MDTSQLVLLFGFTVKLVPELRNLLLDISIKGEAGKVMLIHVVINEVDQQKLWLLWVDTELLNESDGRVTMRHESQVEVVDLRLGEFLKLRNLFLNFFLLTVQEDNWTSPDEISKVAGCDVREEGKRIIMDKLLHSIDVAELTSELHNATRAIGDKFFSLRFDGTKDTFTL